MSGAAGGAVEDHVRLSGASRRPVEDTVSLSGAAGGAPPDARSKTLSV
jgi:hypothetical protein